MVTKQRRKCTSFRAQFVVFCSFFPVLLLSGCAKRKAESACSSECDISDEFTLFIAVNVNRVQNPPWLEDCNQPTCSYQIFGDHASQSVVAYPAEVGTGYGFFGSRGRFQMDWALNHVSYTYFLRVDEDGYLCVRALLEELKQMPKSNFLMGKFHCDVRKARMDENFMLFSRDVVEYFTTSWNHSMLPFYGESTLVLNIGSQLSRLWVREGWTFRDEQKLIRWDEPFEPAEGCAQYFWMHHLNVHEINLVHDVLHSSKGMASLKHRRQNQQITLNETGCGWLGIPAFHDLAHVAFTRGNRGATLFHDFRPNSSR